MDVFTRALRAQFQLSLAAYSLNHANTVVTSAIFLLTILGLVAYLTATERRVAERA